MVEAEPPIPGPLPDLSGLPGRRQLAAAEASSYSSRELPGLSIKRMPRTVITVRVVIIVLIVIMVEIVAISVSIVLVVIIGCVKIII